MGYRKMGICVLTLGLLYDDLCMVDSPVMQEALRRLTPEQQYYRLFRIRRATLASIKQDTEIDKEFWTTPEQDIPYLAPLITLAEAEVSTHQNFDDLTMAQIPESLKKRNRSS